MEAIASILGRVTAPEERTLSRDLRPGNNMIAADAAQKAGYVWQTPPPPSAHCPHCGRKLNHYGIVSPAEKRRIVLWIPMPETCTCPAAQKEREEAQQQEARRREEEEQTRQRERINKRINSLFLNSGMRGRWINQTFENFEVNEFNRDAVRVAEQYSKSFASMLPKILDARHVQPPERERNGLFITGGYGTGKTHLATAIANQLIEQGVPVICMTMMELLDRLRQSFDRADKHTEAEILRLYVEIPLLIIDDLGSEQPTEWGISKIYRIINARYETYMPVIVTTNYGVDEIIDRMAPGEKGSKSALDKKNAEKTLDRLRGVCLGIYMAGPSFRTR